MRLFRTKQPETRSSYTDAVIAALYSQVSGGTVAAPQTLAAVEYAAGAVGRAFATAEVSPSGTAAAKAVIPSVMEMTGRSLVFRGEVLFLIESDGMGGVVLVPASRWDITGLGPVPSSWRYRVDLQGPSGSSMMIRPAAGVVHIRINVDPAKPWAGVSPLTNAKLTARLAAGAENALVKEAAIPSARIAPVPTSDKEQLGTYQAMLVKGGIVPVEAATVAVTGAGQEPAKRWEPPVVGPAPSQAFVQLRNEVVKDVAAATGVPADLYGSREAFRHFLDLTVDPWAEIVEAEFRDKLDVPMLTLTFDRLRSADIVGRGRAVHSMVQAGVPLEIALAMARVYEGGPPLRSQPEAA